MRGRSPPRVSDLRINTYSLPQDEILKLRCVNVIHLFWFFFFVDIFKFMNNFSNTRKPIVFEFLFFSHKSQFFNFFFFFERNAAYGPKLKNIFYMHDLRCPLTLIFHIKIVPVSRVNLRAYAIKINERQE